MGRVADTACACARGGRGCGGGEALSIVFAALTGLLGNRPAPAGADLCPKANVQMAVSLFSQKNPGLDCVVGRNCDLSDKIRVDSVWGLWRLLAKRTIPRILRPV